MSSPGTVKRLFLSLRVFYLLQIIISRTHFNVKSSQMLCNSARNVEVNQLHSTATISRRAKENEGSTCERKTWLMVSRLVALGQIYCVY